MQQLRLFFAMALLYMFRVTIPPIIRSTMLYMAFQVGRYTYVVILSIFLSRFCLQILLYQMAAFVLYSFLLVFLYW